MAKRKKKWIKKARQEAIAHHHVGALHRMLHVKKGKKIPLKKLKKAIHARGKLGLRARFAYAMRKIQARRKKRRLSHARTR